jgi:hypothetical protein
MYGNGGRDKHAVTRANIMIDETNQVHKMDSLDGANAYCNTVKHLGH